MRRTVPRAAVILLLATSSSSAFASPLGWPQRLTGMRQCYAARVIFMDAAGEASSLLWWASSDNHRNGFLNHSVVIEARQHVQEMIAAADWRFTSLAAREPVDVRACRQHAGNAGARVFSLTRDVLAGHAMSVPPGEKRSHEPRGRQQAPRMPQDRQR